MGSQGGLCFSRRPQREPEPSLGGTWSRTVCGGHGVTESWPFWLFFDDTVRVCVCLESTLAEAGCCFSTSLCLLLGLLRGLWLLVFPLMTSLTGRCFSQGSSPFPLHPKGCLLVVPCRSSRRRRRRRRATPAKHPPLCLRSSSERKRWWRLREPDSTPQLFHQRLPPALRPSPQQLLEGTGWNTGGLDGRASAIWNPLKSLHGLAGEDGTFRWVPAPSPPPSQAVGAGAGETAGEPWCLVFPLPLQPTSRGPAKLSRRESLFRILTFFFKNHKTLRSPVLRRGGCSREGVILGSSHCG